MCLSHARSGVFCLLLIAVVLLVGCGGKLDSDFNLAYLTFGLPDAPEGQLTRVHHTSAGAFETEAQLPLSRAAVLLFPPPYPAGKLQFLTIASGYETKHSALWEVDSAADASPRHVIKLANRVVLLWRNNPGATTAAVVFVAPAHAQIRKAEFAREAVALRANARCSVAVLDYARPDSLLPVGRAAYAAPAWLGPDRLGYINSSGRLLALDLHSDQVDTVLSAVEAVSSAPLVGLYAVAFRGDSVAVFDSAGRQLDTTIAGAAVPVISPDGAWLAYHATDHGVHLLERATGTVREFDVGYPLGWSPAGDLLLYFERRLDDRNAAYTLFHVAAAATGKATTLPRDGFIVDAVLLP